MYPYFYLEIRTLLLFSNIMLLLSNEVQDPYLHDMKTEYKHQVSMLLYKLLCNEKVKLQSKLENEL